MTYLPVLRNWHKVVLPSFAFDLWNISASLAFNYFWINLNICECIGIYLILRIYMLLLAWLWISGYLYHMKTFATTDTVAVAWSLSSKVYILKSDFHSMFHDTILDGMLGFGTLKSLDGTVMQTESDSKYRWYILQFNIITTNDF